MFRPNEKIYIGFGKHQAIEELGGQSSVRLHSAQESKGGTEVEFILSTVSKDAYHFNLEKGKKWHLMMAYSHEDDFMHHSAMRTSLEIIL